LVVAVHQPVGDPQQRTGLVQELIEVAVVL